MLIFKMMTTAAAQTNRKVVFVLAAFMTGCLGAQWSADPADGVTVYVCEGQDLTLPWNITTDPSEEIIDKKWLFQGNSSRLLAVYTKGMFLPAPYYSGRLQHMANGGIALSNVTLEDAGNFTMEVNMHNESRVHVNLMRTAFVRVVSAMTDATLEARQEPTAVYDNQTGQLHVQLTCTSQGSQLPALIWTTPTNQTLNSTEMVGDASILRLPNPISGGNYTCRLPSDSSAAKCLPPNDPAREGATVHVDKIEARMALLEAGQTSLRQQNEELKSDKEGLRSEIVHLKTENSDMKTNLIRLQHQVHTLEEFHQKQVVFHAELGSDIQLAGSDPIIPHVVSVNHGDAYNVTSGEFHVPHNGTYFFTATSGGFTYSSNSDYYANLWLKVDSRIVSYIRTKSVDYWEQGTCSYAGHLSKGQRVWLQAAYDGYFNGELTTFSGFLVRAD